MASSDKSIVTPNNYVINIIRTSTTQQEECSFLYCHLKPKCEWLPNVIFQHNDSEIVNHQIILIRCTTDAIKKSHYYEFAKLTTAYGITVYS